jgi:Spy/CpxP family protein refolding chaperone
MVKDLNLTPAQSEQMKAHRKTQMEQMKQLNKSMKEAQEALRIELDKSNTDMVAVEKLTGDLKSIEAKKIDSRTQGILDVKKTLTPDQFGKMCEKMKKEFKKMKGKMDEDGKDEAMEDMPPPPMQEQGMDDGKDHKDMKNNMDDSKKDESKSISPH